jgi:hypothetical protein
MALSPDGQIMYLPSLEKDHWHVINAPTGEIITKVFRCRARTTRCTDLTASTRTSPV